MNNENIANVSGSISIYDYKPRQGVKEIVGNSEWFNSTEYYSITDDGECLVIKKCYMEIPKKALKIYKDNHLRFECEAINGTFEIDEESNEDELVIYYR